MSVQMRHLRVIVINDHLSLLTKTVDMLEYLGHEVSPAESAEKARELLYGQGSGFDLAIVDDRMQGIPGANAAEFVRQYQPEAKVIILSGAPAGEQTAEGIAKGEKYLKRPLRLKDLQSAVERALGEDIKEN